MARAAAKDVELETLREFLTATADSPLAQVGDLARARALAARLAHRLERPLRVLVAGEPGSGKSTLTNALAGDPVLPINNMPIDMPPVFVRYGTPRTSFAGWWGEKDRRRSDTLNLRELAALVPDFIVIQGEFPRLTDINLFDIQGRDDMANDGSPLLETAGSADMIIWCSTADDPWKVRERQVWAKLPKTLRQHSLMAITHGDHPRFQHDFPRIFERAVQEAARHFNDVVALNAPKGMAAVKGGKVIDAAAWTESGAEQIADALDLAAHTIKEDIIREARAAISAPLAPFIRDMHQAPAARPKTTAAEAEAAAEPAVAPVAPPVETPVAAPEPAPVAAPAPPPEPEVKPEAKPVVAEAPVPDSIGTPVETKNEEPAPEPVVEPAPAPAQPAAAAAAARMHPPVKPDAKPEAKGKAETKPEVKAEPKPEPKAEPKPEPVAEAKPTPKTEAKPPAKESAKEPAAAKPAAKGSSAPKPAAPTHEIKDNPLVNGWNDKITALITQIEGADEVDSPGFLQSCCDIVMDVSNAIGEPGVLNGDSHWLHSQFQDALDLLILLQIETGDDAVEDASTVLLQLARDVSWIGAH